MIPPTSETVLRLISASKRFLPTTASSCRGSRASWGLRLHGCGFSSSGTQTAIALRLRIPQLQFSPASSPSKRSFGTTATALSSSVRGKPFASPNTILKFHQKDNLNPKNFTLIYKTDFQWYLVSTQIMVLLSIGAFVAVLIAATLEFQMEKEESRKMRIEMKEVASAMEKKDRDDEMIKHGKKTAEEVEGVVENIPRLSDAISEDREVIGVFMTLLAGLTLSLYFLMNMLPIRVYVGRKNYCVAMYYGSIFPGRVTRKDFVAGTLTPIKGEMGKKEMAFKEGSGRIMILLNQFFRKPADFEYLIGRVRTFDDFGGKESEMDQMKGAGSFGTPKSRNQ